MAEHWGSSGGLRDKWWSGMFGRMTQRVKAYMLGEGVLGWFERGTSGVFSSVLSCSWNFLYVNEVLSSVFEVLVRIPAVLEVCWRCCLMHLGGSGKQSEISNLEGRYSDRQINFDQKSIRKAWYTIRNQIISRSSGWSDMVGWANILWSETHNCLPR